MIELLTSRTPNGWKVSIALEEMDLAYTVRPIQLSELQQKEAWFLELNPNGRIPVIIDHDNDDFVVFESGAILIYLAEKSGRFLPEEPNQRSRVMQWLMFQMGGIGPMMGQANVFFRYAPEKIPYAIDRYQRESRRLFEVLDGQLQDSDYLVEEYSIADMANYAWVRGYEWSGVDISGLSALQDWLERITERPAVQKGLAVPPEPDSNKPEDVASTGRAMLS